MLRAGLFRLCLQPLQLIPEVSIDNVPVVVIVPPVIPVPFVVAIAVTVPEPPPPPPVAVCHP